MTLPDTDLNRDLLDYLRRRAQPPNGRKGFDLDGWELHVHPDLIDRLAEIADSPQAIVPLYGVASVVVSQIAVALVLGTSTLLLRLPTVPDDVELGPAIEPMCGNGWQAVDPWQTGLPSAVGLARLRALLAQAREHAADAARQLDEAASTRSRTRAGRRLRRR